MRARLTVDESRFTPGLIGAFPLVVNLYGYAEVTAGFGNITPFFGVVEDFEFSADVRLFFYGHK